MKNTAILIHKKRDDLKELVTEFTGTYIYIDTESDFDNPFLKRIKHDGHIVKNIIGSGIRNIHEDLPGYHVVIINESTDFQEIRQIMSELENGGAMILACSDNTQAISKKKRFGVKMITKLFNLAHGQKANNVLSNVQGIPSDMTEHFLKLRGDTCSVLINQRFIIKDHNLDYKYTIIKSDVFTDAPSSIFAYLKCILIISFVFIKFMLSSLSAFIVDYSLAVAGYKLWAPLVLKLLAKLTIPIPVVLLDVEIIATAIARTISSIYNYFVNKKIVFAAKEDTKKLNTAYKYFTLVLIIWVFNTIILKLGTTWLNIPFAYAKIIADIIMYFASFTLQRDLVFKKRNK